MQKSTLITGTPQPSHWPSVHVKIKRNRPYTTVQSKLGDNLFPHSDDDDTPSTSIPDAVPVATQDTDWRSFRARLVALASQTTTADLHEIWAHSISSVEQGCLLLASPLFFTQSQTYFRNSVIFIASHSPTEGSVGFILNKPTEYRIGQVNGEGALPEEYNPCTLFMGGDVARESINIIHRVPGINGSIEILPGIFRNGYISLAKALKDGSSPASVDDVKVMSGMAGWAPGQLSEEIARGVWIPIAASSSLIMSPAAAASGDEMWHMTLQLMGGEYAKLSAAMKESFRPDVMISGFQGSTSLFHEHEGNNGKDASGAGDDFTKDEGGDSNHRSPPGGHNHGSGI